MNTQSAIKTKNLTKNYDGIDRVSKLDLDIKHGQIYGFLGPNGAGKTTTMKMLLGLIQPTEGEIEILGMPLDDKNRKTILKKTGSIIENPSYYGHLTGKENIHIIEELLDLKDGSGDKALKIVGLDKEKDKKVKDYSLGMKQRLGIAMALVRSPQLLILDEPTNGLDPAGTKEIRELIRKLAQDYGITIMISSHLLSEIEKVADHIGVIKDGEMIFQGSMEDLNEKRKGVTVLQTSDNKRALGILRSLSPQIKGKDLIVSETSYPQRARIVRELVLAGIDVYQVREKHKSLEELFLDLTGEED